MQSTGGGGWVCTTWHCWVVVEEKEAAIENESMLLAKERVLKPRQNMCFTGVKTTRQTLILSSFAFAPRVTCTQQGMMFLWK